jgi:hypothetical protein
MRKCLLLSLQIGVAVASVDGLNAGGPVHISNMRAYELGKAPSVSRHDVLAFLGCLATSDLQSNAFVSFRELASKKSAIYKVRYTVGQIAGTSGGAGERSINLAVYFNKDYFVLYFAELVKGGLLINADTYDLSKDKHGWHMIEGNGGFGTQRAMAAFAKKLEKMELLSIKSDELPMEPGCLEFE